MDLLPEKIKCVNCANFEPFSLPVHTWNGCNVHILYSPDQRLQQTSHMIGNEPDKVWCKHFIDKDSYETYYQILKTERTKHG